MAALDERGTELINGQIISSPSRKPLHWDIQLDLIMQFSAHGQWRVAAEQTVTHPSHGDEPRPDFFALPTTAKVDPEGSFPGDEIRFVAEVLSRNNKGSDLVDKVEVYARFGIDLYLIIDPFKGWCTLHSDPREEGYATSTESPFGDRVALPEPVGFSLDTRRFGRCAKNR
ncbi:Uma2 family endonuclease [Streptomyces sp. NPDC127098]|uniref:Uma2 family endonuclease n=1 Tax=Streptomyces sp. NPDC127098 TaxID=3347137 RepID=UPI00366907FE